jgi:glyoxylase-like metal-dependent hydrolase (beta-lactamase superfamily II)
MAMSKYVIYPLNLGWITREKSMMAHNLNPGTKVDLPVFAWYLTNGKKKVLVDTGGIKPDGVQFVPYRQSRGEQIDQALGNIGVNCEEISSVILTHLHWDHCSQNNLFVNANIYVQKKELQYAVTPIPIHRKSYIVPLIFQTEYEVLNGDVKFDDEIHIVLTPGHSPGSQTVIVGTEMGQYALIGDLVNFRECWTANPKIPNGFHTDLVECYESFSKVEALVPCVDRILMAHEPDILEHRSYPH